jgi:hypothetical protein
VKKLSRDAVRRGVLRTAKKYLWERDVRLSKLGSITRAEARLHRINLSSDEHGYKELLKLGDFKDASNFGWQNPNYDRKYTRHSKDFSLNAFVNPKKRYRPRMMVYIYPRKDLSPEEHKRFLNQLNSSLPRLKVSSVEYAVDLFCKSPDTVRGLFEVIIKYLYIRSQREIIIIDNSENRHSNRLYRIGKYYKMYERGKDIHKQREKGWHVKDLDRVRFEFTADREKLKEREIKTLEDLIDDPKFIYLNFKKYLFRQFKYTKRSRKLLGPYGKRLPAPYERYKAKDKSGVSGTYHSEYFKLKEKLTNYPDYIMETYFFDALESLLYEAMGNFGIEWRGA